MARRDGAGFFEDDAGDGGVLARGGGLGGAQGEHEELFVVCAWIFFLNIYYMYMYMYSVVLHEAGDFFFPRKRLCVPPVDVSFEYEKKTSTSTSTRGMTGHDMT